MAGAVDVIFPKARAPPCPHDRRSSEERGLMRARRLELTVLVTVTEAPMVEQGSAEEVFRLRAL